MPNIWKVAPGQQANNWEIFRKAKCIALGWDAIGDFQQYKTPAEIFKALKKQYGKTKGNGKGAARSIWRFVNVIQQPDVIVANRGESEVVGIGVVNGRYFHTEHPENPVPVPPEGEWWRRNALPVDWRIQQPVDLHKRNFFVASTVTQLKSAQWDQIRKAYLEKYPKLERTLDQLFGESSPKMHPPKQKNSGAGFGNPEENKLVESAAVKAVLEDYKGRGWAVQSVEQDKCGYDLECSKQGLIEQVEVKGVSGTELSFNITANEVKQAQENPKFVLVVVTSALSSSPKLTKFSGAMFCKRFKLSVIQYRAALAS